VAEALAALAPIAAIYLLAARGCGWPRRRAAAFLAGLALLGVAAGLGDDPLARHMAAHALMVCGAAPLLVLGAPVSLALRRLPRAEARELAALIAARPLRWLVNPLIAWALFVAVQLAFHVTPLFAAALDHPLLHALEHAAFLVSALAFWDCAIGTDPIPGRPSPPLRALMLLTAMPAMDASGVYLMAIGHGAAGAAMMVGSMPLALAAGVVGWRWLDLEETRAKRREALGAAG
jgi:putative membrane protein